MPSGWARQGCSGRLPAPSGPETTSASPAKLMASPRASRHRRLPVPRAAANVLRLNRAGRTNGGCHASEPLKVDPASRIPQRSERTNALWAVEDNPRWRWLSTFARSRASKDGTCSVSPGNRRL